MRQHLLTVWLLQIHQQMIVLHILVVRPYLIGDLLLPAAAPRCTRPALGSSSPRLLPCSRFVVALGSCRRRAGVEHRAEAAKPVCHIHVLSVLHAAWKACLSMHAITYCDAVCFLEHTR